MPEDAQALLIQLPTNGLAMGNVTLRESLGWTKSRYDAARDGGTNDASMIIGSHPMRISDFASFSMLKLAKSKKAPPSDAHTANIGMRTSPSTPTPSEVPLKAVCTPDWCERAIPHPQLTLAKTRSRIPRRDQPRELAWPPSNASDSTPCRFPPTLASEKKWSDGGSRASKHPTLA